MAGRNYFFWMFAIVLLTSGLIGVVDPRALFGLLVGIGRILLVAVMAIGFLLLLIGLALFAGPVDE